MKSLVKFINESASNINDILEEVCELDWDEVLTVQMLKSFANKNKLFDANSYDMYHSGMNVDDGDDFINELQEGLEELNCDFFDELPGAQSWSWDEVNPSVRLDGQIIKFEMYDTEYIWFEGNDGETVIAYC